MEKLLLAVSWFAFLASVAFASQACNSYPGSETFTCPSVNFAMSTDYAFQYGTVLYRGASSTGHTECVGAFNVKSVSGSAECGDSTWGRSSTSGDVSCPSVTSCSSGRLYPVQGSSPFVQWITLAQYNSAVAYDQNPLGNPRPAFPVEYFKGMSYVWYTFPGPVTNRVSARANLSVMCIGAVTAYARPAGGSWTQIGTQAMPVGAGLQIPYTITTPGLYQFRTDLSIDNCEGWAYSYTTDNFNSRHTYYNKATNNLVSHVSQGTAVSVTAVDSGSAPSISQSGSGTFSPSSFTCGQAGVPVSFSFTLNNTGLIHATITGITLSSLPPGFTFSNVVLNPALPIVVQDGQTVTVTGTATATAPSPVSNTNYALNATLTWVGDANPCTGTSASGSASVLLGSASVTGCGPPITPNCSITAVPNPAAGVTNVTAVFSNLGAIAHNYWLDCDSATPAANFTASNSLSNFTFSGICAYSALGTFTARGNSSNPLVNCSTNVVVNALPSAPNCTITAVPNPNNGTATVSAAFSNLGSTAHSYWLDCNTATPAPNFTASNSLDNFTLSGTCAYSTNGTYTARGNSSTPVNCSTSVVVLPPGALPNCSITAVPNPAAGITNVTVVFSNLGASPHSHSLDCNAATAGANFTASNSLDNFTLSGICTYSALGTFLATGNTTNPLVNCSTNVVVNALPPAPNCSISVVPNPTTGTATVSAAFSNLGAVAHNYLLDCNAATPGANFAASNSLDNFTLSGSCAYNANGTYTAFGNSSNPNVTCSAIVGVNVSLVPNCVISAVPNPTSGVTNVTSVFSNMGAVPHAFSLDCDTASAGTSYNASNSLDNFTLAGECSYGSTGVFTAGGSGTNPAVNCSTAVNVNLSLGPNCALTVVPNPTTSTVTATASFFNLDGGVHTLSIDCNASTPAVNFTTSTLGDAPVFSQDCYYSASGTYSLRANSSSPSANCSYSGLIVNWQAGSCTLSADPASLTGAGSINLTAAFRDMGIGVHASSFDCDGNGAAEVFTSFNGSNVNSSVSCTYSNPASNLTLNLSAFSGNVSCRVSFARSPGGGDGDGDDEDIIITETVTPNSTIEGHLQNLTVWGFVQYYNSGAGGYLPVPAGTPVTITITDSSGNAVYTVEVYCNNNGEFVHDIPGTEVSTWGLGVYTVTKNATYGGADGNGSEIIIIEPEGSVKTCRVITSYYNSTALNVSILYEGYGLPGDTIPSIFNVFVDCGTGGVPIFPWYCSGEAPDGRCHSVICDYSGQSALNFNLIATLPGAQCTTVAGLCEPFV